MNKKIIVFVIVLILVGSVVVGEIQRGVPRGLTSTDELTLKSFLETKKPFIGIQEGDYLLYLLFDEGDNIFYTLSKTSGASPNKVYRPNENCKECKSVVGHEFNLNINNKNPLFGLKGVLFLQSNAFNIDVLCERKIDKHTISYYTFDATKKMFITQTTSSVDDCKKQIKVVFSSSVSAPSEAESASCEYKNILVLGASNTVYPSYVDYIRLMPPFSECSKFTVIAKGSMSPQWMLEQLKKVQNLNSYNLLIVSPSGNIPGEVEETHIKPLKEIAKLFTNQKAVITISPRKGHGSANYQAKVKNFNSDSTKNVLEIAGYIVVSIHKIMGDKSDNEKCGYCDGSIIHWTKEGDKLVARAILQKVFGLKQTIGDITLHPRPTGVDVLPGSLVSPAYSPALSSRASDIESDPTYSLPSKQIDEVWLQVSPKLGLSNKIWHNSVWQSFNQAYERKQVPSVPQSGKLNVVLKAVHCLDEGKIRKILQSSPMQNYASDILTFSNQYKIKEEFFLAMAKHESHYATAGVASRGTNNPTNIRKSSKNTYTWSCTETYASQKSGTFCKYPSYKEGIKAWFALIGIGNPYVGGGKVIADDIIKTFCPPGHCSKDDPTTDKYVADVYQTVQSYGCPIN